MNLLPFRALVPTLPFGSDASALFARSKFAYRPADFRPSGSSPTYFIYRHSGPDGVTRTILIGLLDLADWENQHILPHEETIVAKENQQIQLTRERGSSVKPVLLTYEETPDRAQLIAELNAPPATENLIVDLREAEEGLRHQIYTIEDTARRDRLQRLLAEQLPLAYVADGHHRLNTIYRMWREGNEGDRYRYLLTGLIAPGNLEILSHFRVLQVEPQRADEQLRDLGRFFRIRERSRASLPDFPGYWSLFYRERCFELRWKRPSAALDVARFNQEVLPAIFGIHEVKATDRMSYWDGDFTPAAIRERLATRPDFMVFCPYPLDRTAFFSTVEPGRLLPPKSTRFEPRMPNGLIVQAF